MLNWPEVMLMKETVLKGADEIGVSCVFCLYHM